LPESPLEERHLSVPPAWIEADLLAGQLAQAPPFAEIDAFMAKPALDRAYRPPAHRVRKRGSLMR